MKLSLKRQRIGCILASIHTGSALNLWSRLVAEADRTGGSFFMFPGGRLDAQSESEYLRNSLYKLVNTENLDGLISWGSTIGGTVSLEELNRFHSAFEPLPYVTIAHKMPGHSCVKFDAYTGMKDLVHHFIKKHNSKRIAFLRGPQTHVSACERYRAFLDALEEENLITEDYGNLISDPFSWTNGEDAIVQLYEKRKLIPGQDYDTLIGSSDMMLFSAVRYLQKYGFRIPQDVRVAAFNDSAESRIFSTPFSTVHMPYEELGLASYRMIKNCLVNENCSLVEDKVLPAQVVIRESCGCNRIRNLVVLPTPPVVKEETEKVQAELLIKLQNLFGIDDALAQALIDPLLIALVQRDSEKFFSLFEMVLSRFFGADRDVRMIFEAVTMVQQSGILPENFYEMISKSVYQLILQVQSSSLSFKRYESDKRYDVLNSLKCGLLSAHDRQSLIQILSEHLPLIGIHTTCVILYEDDEYSRFIGGFSLNSGKGKPLFEAQSELFPAKLLFPVSVQDDYAVGAFLVQPLFTENQPLGYMLTNVAFYDGSIYEDLRSAISSALHGIFLFEQTIASKQIAERAEHAKTEFFANVGADLSDPLIDIVAKLDQMEKTVLDGITDPDILSEQILFIKSQVNSQLEKTNMLVDLTLSQVDDLAMDKRLFTLDEVFPEIKGLPLLYGDPERLAKAFNLIREEYNAGISAKLEVDGVHIVFSTLRHPYTNWAKPSMLLAEKIILLQFGDLIAEKNYCLVVFPYPNLAGLAPNKNARIPEKIISFSGDLPQIADMRLPVVQKSTGNYSEFSRVDKTGSSLIAWNFDTASTKDIINMYSLRHHPELFRASLLCFSTKAHGLSLLDMFENAVRTKKEEPILFINSRVTKYEGWAREENVISISSIEEFDSAVSQILPSLIVFERINLDWIRAVRRRPDTVLVPILILPETITASAETEEICSLPRVLLCNRGVADSPQFGERIKAVLSGDEILPPHTGALVKKAILYLNEHASSQIVRWKLADSVHVSEDYLTRIFHKEIGLSLWEYLNRYRIFLATDLLLNTNGTIYEIAEQTGFQDQAYFCRVFKKIHGIPPGKIRNKADKKSE